MLWKATRGRKRLHMLSDISSKSSFLLLLLFLFWGNLLFVGYASRALIHVSALCDCLRLKMALTTLASSPQKHQWQLWLKISLRVCLNNCSRPSWLQLTEVVCSVSRSKYFLAERFVNAYIHRHTSQEGWGRGTRAKPSFFGHKVNFSGRSQQPKIKNISFCIY